MINGTFLELEMIYWSYFLLALVLSSTMEQICRACFHRSESESENIYIYTRKIVKNIGGIHAI